MSVKFLATNVANAYVNVVAADRMGDASDEFRLTVEEDELDSTLDVIEGDSAHCASMAHILF